MTCSIPVGVERSHRGTSAVLSPVIGHTFIAHCLKFTVQKSLILSFYWWRKQWLFIRRYWGVVQ